MTCQGHVEVTVKDGPFSGRTLVKREGSFEEGTLIYFSGFTVRIEWDTASWKWVAYTVDNNSI
jgi:hypothetical protein